MADAATLRAAFERNEKTLTERPTAGQKTGHVHVRSTDGLACEIESGPWRFRADMPEPVGGGASAPTPGTYEAGALGSCIAIMTRMWAAKLGVPIGALTVEVTFEADTRFLFGVGGVPPRWSALRYRLTVESDAPEADVRRVLDLAHRQSHVRGDLEHSFTIEREVEIVAPTT